MADVKKIEDALASIQQKVDGLSGAGLDISEEVQEIRDAVKSTKKEDK